MSFILFWLQIHLLFCAVFLFGFILLLAWAVKHLDAKQMMKWAVVALVVGLLGALLTSAFFRMGSYRGGNGMWNVMQEMMDYDDPR